MAEWVEKKEYSDQPPIKMTQPSFIKVWKLTPSSVGFNLIAIVGRVKPIMNRLNLDGSRLKISEAVIGDKYGCIILSLRNGLCLYFVIVTRIVFMIA